MEPVVNPFVLVSTSAIDAKVSTVAGFAKFVDDNVKFVCCMVAEISLPLLTTAVMSAILY